MRIGMCVNVGLDKIEFAAKCGFDYIEYRFGHLVDYTDEEFEKLKECLNINNIKCEGVNCFFPSTFSLIGENIDYSQVIPYIEKGMKRAEELGLRYVVFGSGKSRSIPKEMSFDEGFRQLAAFLRDIVAPIAEKSGVTIVIEPLRKPDADFINTVKEGAMLASAVNHPNVKTLVDFYHMASMDNDCSNITDLKGMIFHSHVAEPLTRATPKGGTEELYVNFFKALQEAGCETCSIEASHKDYFAEIEEGLHTIKNVLTMI